MPNEYLLPKPKIWTESDLIIERSSEHFLNRVMA